MFEIIFSQFRGISLNLIILEFIAVISSLLSVLFVRKENVLCFPFGILCTCIYTYIFCIDHLLANMLINIYYTLVNIYGWVLWLKKDKGKVSLHITRANKKDYLFAIILFFCSLLFVVFVYFLNGKLILNNIIISCIDIITTSIFCVAMMFMAYKKIECWILWILGNILSLPLYYYSKLYFSSLLYFILTIIAISSYLKWGKNLREVSIK